MLDQQHVHLVTIVRRDQRREHLVRLLRRRLRADEPEPPGDAVDVRVHR
jgi:hypothetical protein